jgi:1-acyl-sn-glycerol-3-phosphate acyltransferase
MQTATLPAHQNRIRRIFATAFCFMFFGFGGLFILLVVFPLLRLRAQDKQQRHRTARKIVGATFRFFCRMMETVGVISCHVNGREKLKQGGMLVVANHPSLIDVVFLIGLIENPNCVVKSKAWKNPFMLGPILMCGFIPNDDGEKLIHDCVAAIRRGDNLIVFPEGTRTTEDALAKREVNPLKRGVARIAQAGNFPITPILITVSEPMLTKQRKWYQVPKRRADFVLSVGDDISCDTWSPSTTTAPAQTARLYTQHLTDFFNGALQKT